MKNLQRDDIHIISRHSALTEKGIARILKENVYNNKEAWQKFFRLLFISLGAGFTVSGIVFFFAYNWADLHKFAKIGLIEALIIVTTIPVLLPKININIRKIILTGASALTGVLFAVFGQVYQTGANACDFFLAWTIFVTLWVAVSNFAPMWLLYIVLINTTFILYSQQVAKDWPGILVMTSLFTINTVVLITSITLAKYKKAVDIPDWFLNTVALYSAICATIGMFFGIFEKYHFSFPVLILITSTVYVLGIWHGLKMKSGFYLSVIPFSFIVIVSIWLLKNSSGATRFLLVSLFIIIGVTSTIISLIEIQKKWNNEKHQ